jgi:AcrR family transcriptional regulator
MPPPTSGRIAAAARDILVTEGAAAVTMRRVAGVVGLTPMAIYRHYENREALLRAVADTTFDQLARTWGKRSFAGADGEELRALLDETLDEHLDFALGMPNLYFFLFTEQRASSRRYPEDFDAGRSPTFDVLADGLAHAMRAGLVPDEDVVRLGLVVSAELHGLVSLYHGGRIGMSEKDFREFCHTAVWRILDPARS